MRDEFYGDRKDVWKWSLTLQAADRHKRILQVLMYCRDRGKPARDFHRAGQGIDQRVEAFFDDERKAFHTGAPRRVDRIKGLDPRIELFPGLYRAQARHEYFRALRAELAARPDSREYVVLLDPDTGITEREPKDEHLSCQNLAQLWSWLNSRDTLIVYQHQQHVQDWVGSNWRAIARSLKVEEDTVGCFPFGSVCFYRADK